MNEINYSDAVARLRDTLPQNELRTVEIMERVKGQYLATDWDDELRRKFDSLLRTVVTSHVHKGEVLGDVRREARALVVVGEAGTGKTESLNRLFRTHRSLPGYGKIGLGCPLVTVSVPSPCTLKTLGMRILSKLGYPLARDLKEHLIWAQVHDQLQLAGVLILHLDEMHNLTDGANVDEIDKIRKTLKALMASPVWPVALVISGLPEIVPELEEIDEIRRRERFIRVPLLVLPDDLEMIRDIVVGLSKVAGLKSDDEFGLAVAPRLAHAALYRLGILAELVHEAIETALPQDGMLTLDHFATAYTDRSGVSSPMNPFVASNWIDLDCSKVLVEEPANEPVLPQDPRKRTTSRKRSGRKQKESE